MRCRTCDASWENGAFSPDCPECGGGALELECASCFGTCGAVLKRAVMDSNDSHRAHWIGKCLSGVPLAYQLSRYQAVATLLDQEPGKALAEVVVRGTDPGAIDVLRDWLAERGYPTGHAFIGRIALAAARKGTPLAKALWLA
jgi:hypothetical protein